MKVEFYQLAKLWKKKLFDNKVWGEGKQKKKTLAFPIVPYLVVNIIKKKENKL